MVSLDSAMNSAWLAEKFPPMDEELEDERMEVVADLQDLIGEWFETLDFLPKGVRGVDEFILRISGSFRVGVSSKDGDIDIVFIAPQYVQQDLFFESLGPFFEKSDLIEHVNPIPTTRVPIFGLVIRGVEIDLLLASLPVARVPRNFDLGKSSIVAVDRATVDSINGPRVTQYILNHTCENKTSYAIFLKAVREWAKLRGIYGAKMGFLGGIQWSMLTLYIYTKVLYEVRRSPSKLMKTFFHVFSKWDWKRRVVEFPDTDGYHSTIEGWTLKERKPLESMVVLTPMNPRINCTFNVNPNSMVRIQEEFIRAAGVSSWSDLYEPYSIRKHRQFLVLECQNADDDTLGLIESKVRFLPLYIFITYKRVMGQVVLFPKMFRPTMQEKKDVGCEGSGDGSGDGSGKVKDVGNPYFVIGLTIDKEKEHLLAEKREKYDERAPKKKFDIGGDWNKFLYECKIPSNKVVLKSCRKSQLPKEVL